MNYNEAYAKLEKWGQTHVLKYFEELTLEQQQQLLQQIEETDFSVVESCKHKDALNQKGAISPLAAMELSEIQANAQSFRETGLNAIKAGKVGAVLLAGGMGTRLGSDDPKGMYNIGLTKDVYIFERLIVNLMEVVEEAGAWIPLFIMTSDKNKEATEGFLREHEFFGYNKEFVWFFKQEMAPASDYEGKIYMEEKWKMSTSPNGNGGWYTSMETGGINNIVHELGVEWLNVFAVDNVLQRIADPVFVGATIEKQCAVGAKVVRKNAPDEKVGVMCLEDGRPSIVEYYELTEELMNAKDEKGEPAYNFGVILNYLFREADLKAMLEQKLPLHVVEKKIPYINEAGDMVNPEEPNGLKYETLILDMIKMLDSCLGYEVVREKEFAPIKNKEGVDSVESARELLKYNGIEL
jgi:UDP-N-acetylglucosamine/UDP-N-acetylgalactosamine diphosphorylase